MILSERQKRILDQARGRGRVRVEELAESLGVTPQTIRRDLGVLCRRGLLARVHGGAVPAGGIANLAYEERRDLQAAEKVRIGRAAAACIPDGSSLLINIGTTTEQVAHALRDHHDLVVITNNINVVSILSGTPAMELILAGGVVRQSDGAIVGEAAVEFIRNFRADWAVIGASAIDADGTVLDYDYREVMVARAIIESARRVILVADHSKFTRTAPVRIADLEAVDTFVTDAEPPPGFRRAAEAAGTRIVVAEGEGEEEAHG